MAPKRKKKIAIISGLVLALAIVSTLVAMKANAKNKGEVKLPVRRIVLPDEVDVRRIGKR